MRVGIKTRGTFGVKKTGLEGKITKVEKKASPNDPEKKNLFIFFKGINGLGLIQLSQKEMEIVADKLKNGKANEKKKR